MAADSCAAPDASFTSFLAKFKNDKQFRETRLVLPLQFSSTDPSGTTKEALSLEEIRKRNMALILGDKDARELKGSEGALCESKPIIKKSRASFGQYSCGTDVYSDAFYFVRRNGCWMLERVAVSGG